MIDIEKITDRAEFHLNTLRNVKDNAKDDAELLKQSENVRNRLKKLQADIRAEIGSVIDCISEVMNEPTATKWTFEHYKSKFKTVEDANKEFSIGLVINPFTKTFKKDLPTRITSTVMGKKGMCLLPKCTANDIVYIIHALLLYIIFENEVRDIEDDIEYLRTSRQDCGKYGLSEKEYKKVFTPRAKDIFHKAIKENYIIVYEDRWEWNYNNGSDTSFGYFVHEIYKLKRCDKVPITGLEKLFRIKNLSSTIDQLGCRKKDQEWQRGLDELLED